MFKRLALFAAVITPVTVTEIASRSAQSPRRTMRFQVVADESLRRLNGLNNNTYLSYDFYCTDINLSGLQINKNSNSVCPDGDYTCVTCSGGATGTATQSTPLQQGNPKLKPDDPETCGIKTIYLCLKGYLDQYYRCSDTQYGTDTCETDITPFSDQ